MTRDADDVAYSGASLRIVTLCEETGQQMVEGGRCPVHGGDACLYEYRHPYDNATDRWKRAKQWGLHIDDEWTTGGYFITELDPARTDGEIPTPPRNEKGMMRGIYPYQGPGTVELHNDSPGCDG